MRSHKLYFHLDLDDYQECKEQLAENYMKLNLVNLNNFSIFHFTAYARTNPSQISNVSIPSDTQRSIAAEIIASSGRFKIRRYRINIPTVDLHTAHIEV